MHFGVSDEHGFTSKHLYQVICLIKYYQEALRDRQQKRTFSVIVVRLFILHPRDVM